MSREAISVFLGAGKTKILLVAGALVLVIAFMDWSVGNTISLGVLYILPMMLGALVLHSGETAALAVFCALLRACFDVPSTRVEVGLRFIFATLAYYSSGLFVSALVRNRELALENLARVQKEQILRREAEEQLRVLVESSPAAILTADQRGVILAANNAAEELFFLPAGGLQGRIITNYLPLLEGALRLGAANGNGAPQGFRTAAQCYGRREGGDMFLADTWFSTYGGPDGIRLAAIVVDSSEEMRDREEQGLRQLHRHNRIAAAAVSHEVRNLCSAIALLCSTLREKHNLAHDQDLQGLTSLVDGLEHIAELDLHSRSQEALEEIPLRAVLDNLRIVIEPGWREAGAKLEWCIPTQLPRVVADPRGLLQAFLNLAQNSLRAVQDVVVRELIISASVEDQKAAVRFEDSGPGVSAPDYLFQAFQQGVEGTGLGLHISRALLRSYGGELRFEPRAQGSCFVVELQLA